MACVKKRRGRWVVDYRDSGGVRRTPSFRRKREADRVLEDVLRDRRQAKHPSVDPDISFADYALRWLGIVAATVKPRTLESYQQILKNHLLPRFKGMRVREIHRGQIKEFLAQKLNADFARESVRIMHATLRSMLNGAVDDGVILANPAEKLGRQLRLTRPALARQEDIKAMTREQLSHFLATAERAYHRHQPLFMLMARAGLRIGEAVALKPEDIIHNDLAIRVERGFSAGRVETPKSGHGRTVDMSEQLARVLQRYETERKEAKLRWGWPEMPPWLFFSDDGSIIEPTTLNKVFKRILKKAGLPLHFTPHCLRHTYASLLLQQGESPVYVQRQLGHASIKLTVDTYGRWLPMGNKAAVNRLDDQPVAADSQNEAR